jgi:hypothetical protein
MSNPTVQPFRGACARVHYAQDAGELQVSGDLQFIGKRRTPEREVLKPIYSQEEEEEEDEDGTEKIETECINCRRLCDETLPCNDPTFRRLKWIIFKRLKLEFHDSLNVFLYGPTWTRKYIGAHPDYESSLRIALSISSNTKGHETFQ